MTLAYDMYMVAKEAAEVAAEKAFDDGFSAGEERGISIGLSQGISQGAHQKAVETAKSMKLENMSISMISHFTGLSPEEIEKL